MALFGKNEEVEALKQELEDRTAELNDLKRQIELREEVCAKKEKRLFDLEETLSSKEGDLAEQVQSFARSKLEAKNNFAKQQHDIFQKQIDSQLKQLDQQEQAVAQKIVDYEKRLAEVLGKEGQVTDREVKVKELELKSENGFAEKKQVMLRELEKREDAVRCLEEELKIREETIFARHQELESRSETLRQREEKIRSAETIRDTGYTDEKRKCDEELERRRVALNKKLENKRKVIESELTELYEKRLTDLETTISKERDIRLKELDAEIGEKKSLFEEETNKLKTQLKEQSAILAEKAAELDVKANELVYSEKQVQMKQERCEKEQERIEEEVTARVCEQKKSFERELKALQDECERLRGSVERSSKYLSLYEDLEARLGDEQADDVLTRLEDKEKELLALRTELAERPTQEMSAAYDNLRVEYDQLKAVLDAEKVVKKQLMARVNEQSDLEMEKELLINENKSLNSQQESIKSENERLLSEIERLNTEMKRLNAGYERDLDVQKRVELIEKPYIETKLPRLEQETVNELEWLDGIEQSLDNHGFQFPRRILDAFHTALKTSEWSPLTVLAGVSGTGKSELPRLYSHFGGINFMSLSVQPNWDCQESMLGYFNSIDNVFDAQPVLRLLAQSQKDPEEIELGLRDTMNLILLDEMNLAHIELYFAEFLSKLELRRGIRVGELPNLEVKLGAGMPHYNLPLGRNVLWAGTMNQDETTKSLSDKVLDRGIVINFPRPTELKRRKKLVQLTDPAPLLHPKHWGDWWRKGSEFENDDILPYKRFVEEINESLSVVGRALGHRVWQSIEYYMANYPYVMIAQDEDDKNELHKAMKIAFEDQLVQKVMPKLRGIETRRGKARTHCLDKIKEQLANDGYSIIEDFDMACEFGYGQFIWNSANYLKNEEYKLNVTDEPKEEGLVNE